jgi:hypothetical protein
MMLNPVGAEAGPLLKNDELILMCPQMPDLSSFAWGKEPGHSKIPVG